MTLTVSEVVAVNVELFPASGDVPFVVYEIPEMVLAAVELKMFIVNDSPTAM
jgi:hypothetical protein